LSSPPAGSGTIKYRSIDRSAEVGDQDGARGGARHVAGRCYRCTVTTGSGMAEVPRSRGSVTLREVGDLATARGHRQGCCARAIAGRPVGVAVWEARAPRGMPARRLPLYCTRTADTAQQAHTPLPRALSSPHACGTQRSGLLLRS
jgi:hypothetical protein